MTAETIPATLDAVIFDLDGVLVHTDDLHFDAWSAIAGKLGIEFTAKDNDRLRGVSRMESLEILLSLSDDDAHAALGEEEKEALATEKNGIYRRLLERLSPADVASHVRHTLAALRERGMRLAIGSSSKNARPILQATGLIEEFDVVADGTHVTRSKPFPDVFLHAADRLGLDPARCVVVEDAHAGVDAALAGGFACIAIGDATTHPGAHATISKLDEMLDVVAAS